MFTDGWLFAGNYKAKIKKMAMQEIDKFFSNSNIDDIYTPTILELHQMKDYHPPFLIVYS